MSLEESLLSIQDPRRKEGMRHNLYQMFSMIILSGLCGHFGARGVRRFSKANSKIFKELLIPIAIADETSSTKSYEF